MRVVAIVQARVASTRLPAKVLLDLGGQTALARCLARVRRTPGIDDVVVATSNGPFDDLIVGLCKRLDVQCVRGSEHDVLSRYALAAREARADAVVRFTSDCPLLDPVVSGLVAQAIRLDHAPDYASNTLVRRLPRGLDTEAMTRVALDRADREATSGPDREHVTRFLYTNPSVFRAESRLPELARDLSHHRWTLDTLDDYRFLFEVYERLGSRADQAGLSEVLAIVEADPLLFALNAHIEQKAH
jgi:spore coat polysaccharide biosynthesis protein SpsF